MALLFMDGFDHYNTSQAGLKWSTATDITIGTSYKRNGTQGVQITQNDILIKSFSSTAGPLVFGFAHRPESGSGNFILCRIRESTVVHAQLNFDYSTSQYRFYFGDAIFQWGVSSSTYSLGSWNFIEIKMNVHDSTGNIQIKINGVTQISTTNSDTRNGGSGVMDNIQFLCSSAEYWLDDFYILDTTGTYNNDFLGDVKVVPLYPNGIGTYSEWTPLSGDNYTNVDETTPDGDTSYVYTSDAGSRDTYDFEDLVLESGSIFALQINAYARKDDAGSRSVRPLIYRDATLELGNSASLSDSYTISQFIFETDPVDDVLWTETTINDSEFGLELES